MDIDMENLKPPSGALEPEALACKWNKICTPDQATELSKAISLKRIADALWGVEGTAGLLQLLNPLNVRNHY